MDRLRVLLRQTEFHVLLFFLCLFLFGWPLANGRGYRATGKGLCVSVRLPGPSSLCSYFSSAEAKTVKMNRRIAGIRSDLGVSDARLLFGDHSILHVYGISLPHRALGGTEISCGKEYSVNNSLVYSLSMAIYCTAWTYYGSVGKAATSGLLFVPIYLGPTIAIILWWTVLRKLVRLKSSHHITSIADFISARYNKSQRVAALATVMALVGTMPYIALQFKAILTTFFHHYPSRDRYGRLAGQPPGSGGSGPDDPLHHYLGFAQTRSDGEASRPHYGSGRRMPGEALRVSRRRGIRHVFPF